MIERSDAEAWARLERALLVLQGFARRRSEAIARLARLRIQAGELERQLEAAEPELAEALVEVGSARAAFQKAHR